MWEVKKIQDFCPRDMESCHFPAARRIKLWSLNANLFFKEPQQLTKFTWWDRLDFRRSLEFGYPPREETAGRVSDRLCLWRKFKI